MPPAVRRLAFALALVLPGPVVGACVAAPPGPVAQVTGSATIKATAHLGGAAGRSLAAVVPEYTAADISHVVLTLYSWNGTTETQLAEVDVPSQYLSQPATFSKLRANASYRLRAKAYKSLGRGLQDQISVDATSVVTVATAEEDRETWAAVPVKLAPKFFDAFTSVGTDGVTAGAYVAGLRGLVLTMAGDATSGAADGQGPAASFNNPGQLAAGPGNSVLVVDGTNHKIRKVEPNGDVTTFSGTGSAGTSDQPVAYNGPSAITFDGGNYMYVADTNNHVIREVDVGADMAFLAAGTMGVQGDQEGQYDGVEAKLRSPRGICAVGEGVQSTLPGIYIADTGNNKIRHFDPSVPGYPTATLAGSGTAALADGIGVAASFSGPRGLTTDGQSFVYIADTGNHAIRRMRIDDPGVFDVETLAGDGTAGSDDGPGASARFNNPASVALDYEHNWLYVADSLNHKIRRIDLNDPSFPVTTVAGSGTAGVVDGTGAGAGFHSPVGIFLANDFSLVVADRLGHRLRRVR